MHLIQKIQRGIWLFIWYFFAVVIVFSAAVFGLARLLLPLVGDYNQDIEKIASEYIGQPIKIMSLEAEWHGISPSLILNNARLMNKTGDDTLFLVSRIRMDFDLVDVLLSRRMEFKRLALSGANLSIVRKKNGQLRLAGFESGLVNNSTAVGVNEPSQLGLWILSQGEINLHARNLIFTDKINSDKKYHFTNISLKLWNEEDHHTINGSVEFANNSNQEFEFTSELTGDFINSNNWSGVMYFHGANINFSKIFGKYKNNGNEISVGKSNFKLWSDWNAANLVGIQGDIEFRDVRCNASEGATAILAPLLRKLVRDKKNNDNFFIQKPVQLNYANIVGRFKWRLADYGWELLFDDFLVAQQNKTSQKSDISVRYFSEKTAPFQYNVRVNQVDISSLTPILPVLIGDYSNYLETISKLAPSGIMKGINAAWAGESDSFTFGAELDNVGVTEYKYIPGFKGLSGKLNVDQNGGSFDFDTQAGNFYMPSVFRWDIPVKKLSGLLSWVYADTGILLSSRNIELSTAHFDSKAVMDITIPKSDDSPFISIITNFEKADASKASYYFPIPIMSEKVLKWLDSAIVQGNIPSGAAIIYGPIREFPFTKGQGVFDVRFNVNEAILDYAENWPILHGANAAVSFKGNQLKVKINKAKLFDSQVSGTNVEIPDMSAAKLKLNIDGKVSGKTQNYIKYLMTAPPLAKRYGDAISVLRPKGDSDLDLKLNLTISTDISTDVSGKLTFIENKLELPQIPNLLKNINGEVNFENGAISGKDINALLLNQPTVISVRTHTGRLFSSDRKVSRTDYVAVGKFNVESLSQASFPFASNILSGDAVWKVKLSIPAGQVELPKQELMHISMTSDLQGVNINVPVPLNKNKEEKRDLNISAIFRHNASTLLKMHYGDDFSALVESNFSDKNWLERGSLHFGASSVVLPERPGLQITGTPKVVSYDKWKDFIKGLIAKWDQDQEVIKGANAKVSSENKKYEFITSADIHTKQLNIFGQSYKDVAIKAENKGSWVTVNLDSSNLAGDITVPYNLDQKPIVLNLQRLNLTPIEGSGEKLKVRDIPAIQFYGREVSYGNKKLGKVAIETAKTEHGLLLQQLIVKPRSTTIKGSGSWTTQGDSEKSVLSLDVDSENIGNAMKDLGYVETISDGKGKISAKLSWSSGLIYPDIEHLNGELSLRLKNGRILDIEPGGAARLFGLFSLQTLPRRLTLDFSDIFSKGLGFDRIVGNFKIDNGNAFTNDLKLTGPNADVSLNGRIGLAAQDYDQKIKVTPHITDATVLLSIITNQPLLLFLQQLMKNDIDAATSFEYTLMGPWDHYELKPVLKKAPAASVPDDF